MRTSRRASISGRARGLATVAAVGVAIVIAVGAPTVASAAHPAHAVTAASGAVTPADAPSDIYWT